MSSQPPEPPASKLDQLSLTYLDTIDTYQSLITTLSTRLSAGYLSLAQANYHAPAGTRYGADFYDERMSAMHGVDISAVAEEEDAEDGTKFELKKIELPEETSEEENVIHKKKQNEDGGNAEGLRRRKPEPQEDPQGTHPEDSEPEPAEPPQNAPKIDPRDPLRWFGILVPPALRASQSEFRSSLEVIPSLATTLSKLASLERQITHHRHPKHLYKILTSPPPDPLPEVFPTLEELDAQSGYIHLCTAAQVPTVISLFMPSAQKLWVLKIHYSCIAQNTKWEKVVLEAGAQEFPHLFGTLGADDIERVLVVEKGEGGWTESLKDEKWMA